MKKELNIEEWNRAGHFNFFSQFDEPFFGVNVRVNCAKAYEYAKNTGNSFFLIYLHRTLKAANKIQPFKYRIEEGKVFQYDDVHASPTIARTDGTFGFSYMPYQESFYDFKERATTEIDKVAHSKGLELPQCGLNVIHCSSMPWLDFTSVSHARHFKFEDSCPKISFGKMTGEGEDRSMPISIHVHHALMDGYEVGLFVEEFQKLMNLEGEV
ncbi:CatA-like O-acetyltransferase [Maribacter sp. MAR_2009_72]|uniref:CatA-like O-acetyltransferase n=1 Tax=Maribacter sp. MAR_2009_72 TaxID=1250050 RepID=UPI001199AD53|nr:CatA-like O-acetyltransferase [Maribacter sp. MAR_2009_72]TVZ16453.1 chloramphenicol O-acetyltransferase type A [Maribacter sp. MAR_2009_72]